MPEPLREIRFSILPYSIEQGIVVRYYGRDIFVANSWGFWRVNADTGKADLVVSVRYESPDIPAARIGTLGGDHNQSVSQLGVSSDWVVVDNLAPIQDWVIERLPKRPVGAIFKNDRGLTTHGAVPYPPDGLWWSRGGNPIIVGDRVWVRRGDRTDWNEFNARTLTWVGASTAPADPTQPSIEGYTYTCRKDGDPWAGDRYRASNYILRRSDVAVSEPLPTAPSSPLPPQPPTPEEPMPVPIDPNTGLPQGTPPGLPTGGTGGPLPPGTPPPTGPLPPGTPPPYTPPPVPAPPAPSIPIVPETTADFAEGISLRLFVHDSRLPNVGMGKVVRLTPETVAFHYGNPSNLEVFAKVLDGRGVNGHFWIFSSGLTDVGVRLVAIKGDATKEYASTEGTPFPTTLDTSAF